MLVQCKPRKRKKGWRYSEEAELARLSWHARRRDNVCFACHRTWTPTPEMWLTARLVCTHCGAVHMLLGVGWSP